MKRLQCIGKPSEVSSKVTEQETAPIKPLFATSADPLPKESVEWKPKQQKPKPSGKTEVQDPTINFDTTNPTLGAQSSKRPQKTKPSRKTERQDPFRKVGTANPTPPTQNTASGGHNAPKAPSFKNVTTHGHKVPKQVLRVMTGQQATSEVQLGCGHELQILSKSDPDPPVEQFEEEESEENETADSHVPLQLFAEFLEAVMTKNYQLAKKLCQMIIIYEPQNSEAKSFLPLIEEKLLIETDVSSDNDESDTSDDEEEEDSSDDEDTDDNESSDSCDTDEESTDSTDDDTSSSSSSSS